MIEQEAMQTIVLPGLLGMAGGLTRGVVGLLKAMSLRRKILWGYWLVSALVAMIIGAFVGLIFNFDYRLSLLAGYAGTDIIESIYKSFQVQKVYVVPAGHKK
jgi:fluoride ion exporter CrcB/FEX